MRHSRAKQASRDRVEIRRALRVAKCALSVPTIADTIGVDNFDRVESRLDELVERGVVNRRKTDSGIVTFRLYTEAELASNARVSSAQLAVAEARYLWVKLTEAQREYNRMVAELDETELDLVFGCTLLDVPPPSFEDHGRVCENCGKRGIAVAATASPWGDDRCAECVRAGHADDHSGALHDDPQPGCSSCRIVAAVEGGAS